METQEIKTDPLPQEMKADMAIAFIDGFLGALRKGKLSLYLENDEDMKRLLAETCDNLECLLTFIRTNPEEYKKLLKDLTRYFISRAKQ